MADRDTDDKGKDKELSNVTMPFSEEQITFLLTLVLEEQVPLPGMPRVNN